MIYIFVPKSVLIIWCVYGCFLIIAESESVCLLPEDELILQQALQDLDYFTVILLFHYLLFIIFFFFGVYIFIKINFKILIWTIGIWKITNGLITVFDGIIAEWILSFLIIFYFYFGDFVLVKSRTKVEVYQCRHSQI